MPNTARMMQVKNVSFSERKAAMRNKLGNISLANVVLFLFIVAPAHADPVTVTFSGEIIGYAQFFNFRETPTSLSMAPLGIWTSIGPSVGTTFSGTYTYDDETIDGSSGGAFGDDTGSYANTDISGEVGGLLFSTISASNGGILIFNNLTPTSPISPTGIDTYLVVGGSCCAGAIYDDGGTDLIIGMGLFLTGADAFADDSLFFPTLGDYPTAQFRWSFNGGFAGIQSLVGNVTSLTLTPNGGIDTDGDGVVDDDDLCATTAPAAAVDANGCSDAEVDGDGDGICDVGAPSGGPSACSGTDNCPIDPNTGQENQDGDVFGDVCDSDIDGDGVENGADNCPTDVNATQDDFDTDGSGDACDNDTDGDGVADGVDICASTTVPEAVPTASLLKNRYALTGPRDNDNVIIFVSTNRTEFTTTDTGGCSCEQIINALSLGGGHVLFGCSKSVMQQWSDRVF